MTATTPASKALNGLIISLASVLKDEGYRRSGATFRKLQNRSVAVINIQRSTTSSAATIRFTLNLGVFSNRLEAVLGGNENLEPKEYECHLRTRLGMLGSSANDKWWQVSNEADCTAAITEILPLIRDTAIPYLDRWLSDNALLDLWLSGSSPGITDFLRLEYASSLAMALGRNEDSASVIRQLQIQSIGKPYADSAAAHIRKLAKLGENMTSGS